ncbi:MAG: response regulator transcription factor, partial [Chloroflexota bacterium]
MIEHTPCTPTTAAETGRVLAVDDNADIQELLKSALSDTGFEMISAANGTEGISRFLEDRPDVVLVDVLMPGMDGYELCRRLRDLSDVPIVMLSALRNEAEIVRGLDAGADDYITKPFSPRELVARLRAQLRRKRRAEPPQRQLAFDGGRLVVDLDAQRVVRDQTDVHVSPTEFRLLAYLVANAGRVVPHRELVAQIWGTDAPRLGRYLKIYVGRLRRKIEDDAAHPQRIVSRHGSGYS